MGQIVIQGLELFKVQVGTDIWNSPLQEGRLDNYPTVISHQAISTNSEEPWKHSLWTEHLGHSLLS